MSDGEGFALSLEDQRVDEFVEAPLLHSGGSWPHPKADDRYGRDE